MLENFGVFARMDDYRPVGEIIGYDDMNKRQKKRADAEYDEFLDQIMIDGSEFAMNIGLWNEKDDFVEKEKERKKKLKEQQRTSTEGIDEELTEISDGCVATIVRTKDDDIIFSVITPPRQFTRSNLLERCVSMNSTTFNSAEIYLSDKELKTLLVYSEDNGFVATLNPTLSILFRKEERPDPLDEVWHLETVEDIEYDLDNMEFYTGVREDGSKFAVPFKENSGYVVAGLPGSGKSASFLPLLASMVYQDAVELTLIDGKGTPNEFDYFDEYGLADVYKFKESEDGGNHEEILEVMRNFKQEVSDRAEGFKEKYGVTNFWNIPVEQRPKLKIMVIDECQEFFEQEGEKDMETRQMKQQMINISADIIRRKRDAGAMLCVVTQRPSSETLPKKIASNAPLKVSFRLNDTRSESMALDDEPSEYESKYRATKIPNKMQGLAIARVGDTEALRERVRFAHYGKEQLVNDLEKIRRRKKEKIING